jgi:hypothetical protein
VGDIRGDEQIVYFGGRSTTISHEIYAALLDAGAKHGTPPRVAIDLLPAASPESVGWRHGPSRPRGKASFYVRVVGTSLGSRANVADGS